MPRILPHDTLTDAADRLGGGVFPAMCACIALIHKKNANVIDPDAAELHEHVALRCMMDLDALGIWGRDLERLWNLCGHSATRLMAMLRAAQLGIISDDGLKAVAAGHETLDPRAVLLEVQKELPRFGRNVAFRGRTEVE